MQRNRNYEILDFLTQGESFTDAPCTPSRRNKLTGANLPDYSNPDDWSHPSTRQYGQQPVFEDVIEATLGGHRDDRPGHLQHTNQPTTQAYWQFGQDDEVTSIEVYLRG